MKPKSDNNKITDPQLQAKRIMAKLDVSAPTLQEGLEAERWMIDNIQAAITTRLNNIGKKFGRSHIHFR